MEGKGNGREETAVKLSGIVVVGVGCKKVQKLEKKQMLK